MSDKTVIMRMNISGGRHDGRPWPPTGHPLTLPAAEADDLVRGGMAWPAPDQDVAAVGIPAASAATTAADLQPPSQDVAAPAAAGEAPAPAVVGDPAAPPVAPVAYAPKQAWIDHAMAQGATEDEANMMTKAELQERYGDRP